MYLEHFGLTEPPFKITPVTDFFFSGANRGEILDALIYAIKDSEGIVKVSGEVGSGKTMLCRMLLDRLPSNIKAIYLANPSMSRDELLYAIADRLDLNLEGQRVNVILQTLQNQLEAMYERGERCVVLVDEAHAMPLDTLEELRLLYNLQVGKHKLIQIVLFGQPELDEKLDQSNMRQLKDRIVHHFSILPISRKVIDDYLMFRMRAAGYKGPDIFSPAAVLHIGKASQGLMRRVNILADKALLAAFVENTHKIEVASCAGRHPRQRNGAHAQLGQPQKHLDGGRSHPARRHIGRRGLVRGAKHQSAEHGRCALTSRSPATACQSIAASDRLRRQPAPASASAVAAASEVMPAFCSRRFFKRHDPPARKDAYAPRRTRHAQNRPASSANCSRIHSCQAGRDGSRIPLFCCNGLDATQHRIDGPNHGTISIQLFYTDDIRPERMERFLVRAQRLGKFAEIYIVPIKLNGKDGYRVLYGLYANSDAARTGMEELPQRYKEAFAPTLYLLEDSQNMP